MYKEELILIHQLMVYLMRFLIDSGASDSYFEDYKNLGINPHHIYRTKAEHKYAVFLLAKGISEIMSGKDLVPAKLNEALGRLVERCGEECYRLK
jgi:hypothetical protein